MWLWMYILSALMWPHAVASSLYRNPHSINGPILEPFSPALIFILDFSGIILHDWRLRVVKKTKQNMIYLHKTPGLALCLQPGYLLQVKVKLHWQAADTYGKFFFFQYGTLNKKATETVRCLTVDCQGRQAVPLTWLRMRPSSQLSAGTAGGVSLSGGAGEGGVGGWTLTL